MANVKDHVKIGNTSFSIGWAEKSKDEFVKFHKEMKIFEGDPKQQSKLEEAYKLITDKAKAASDAEEAKEAEVKATAGK